MCAKCSFPDGVVIKPDGINELDPCIYQTEQVFTNVTVEISKCKKCGHVNISWYKNPDTVEISPEEWDDICSQK